MPHPSETFPTSELAQRVASASASQAQFRKRLNPNHKANPNPNNENPVVNYDLKKCELLEMVQYSCNLEPAEAGAGDSSSSSTSRMPSTSAEKVIRCWPVVKLFRRFVRGFFSFFLDFGFFWDC